MKNQDRIIQEDGFDTWFYRMLANCESCLMRDVIRNQKKNLLEEWLKIRPMIDSQSYERGSKGRIITPQAEEGLK